MNIENYRFSIAFPQLIPTGKLSDGVNQTGIDFYNNLIDELVANGIEPFVTLFHFDLPSALQEEYHGLLSSNFVEDFTNYADLCFKTFGDRVKHWITINEPQPTQKGEIGISVSAQWFLPLGVTPADKHAAQRAWDFMTGWFLDPLVSGDYPFNMKAILRDRLPTFTEEQEEMVKGSFDFIGLNYCTSRYTKPLKLSSNDVPTGYENDQYVQTLTKKNEVPIGEQAGGFDAIFVYPEGLGEVLLHLKLAYNNPTIYITENEKEQLDSIETILQDDVRIEFLQNHLTYVRKALSEGVNLKGYFIWSLLDNMEMGSGYTIGFGLHYVDHDDDFKRHPKRSVTWLQNFITGSSSSSS
ncbi:Beta-glucosidase 24 [Camellia lanceoleosa]|uniref:Beta-glucosidase 24 n=1 Tax=Camellia lanceoleosa TaxID=1840588 RepID=A0ACC0HDW9_9ERIC|nr:Beta-glucosidase 24 [Camellia lanceoleosa]